MAPAAAIMPHANVVVGSAETVAASDCQAAMSKGCAQVACRPMLAYQLQPWATPCIIVGHVTF